MKLDNLSAMSDTQVEAQINEWLTEHEGLLKSLYTAVEAIAKATNCQRRGTVEYRIEREGLFVLALCWSDQWDVKRGKSIVVQSIVINYKNKVVARARWTVDSGGYCDTNYRKFVRPGAWMRVADAIIREGNAAIEKLNKASDLDRSAALRALLNPEIDL